MSNKVNVALQVLPKSESKHAYDIVDQAIKAISESGLKYTVCPFETVIEGPYDEIMQLVDKVQQECFDYGADEMMVYIKIQRKRNSDVTIDDKMAKYK